MFYEPGKTEHGLSHDPFKSCVVPRPIGWISTISENGVANLAPYSQFQNLTFDPPYVMFAANQRTSGRRKDSVVNAERTGDFVYNMVTYDLREAMNITAQEVDPDVDEFDLAGLEKGAPNFGNSPRVAASPVQFECAYHQTLRLPGNNVMGTVDIVIGRVLGIRIQDEVIRSDGKLDMMKIRPLARLGYYDYTSVESVFEMAIPGTNEDLRSGMEGKTPKA